MSEWNFLGRYAVTSYAGSAPCEYVVKGKTVVGYVQQGQDALWTYYHFLPQEKGSTMPKDPEQKATARTAVLAVEKSM